MTWWRRTLIRLLGGIVPWELRVPATRPVAKLYHISTTRCGKEILSWKDVQLLIALQTCRSRGEPITLPQRSTT